MIGTVKQGSVTVQGGTGFWLVFNRYVEGAVAY
jgi:hypothetical protein